jgi:GTP cyclohydrolase I
MADAIADTIVAAIQPRAVTVRIVARHLCMEMRGTDGHPKVEVVAKRGEAVIR